MLNLVILRWRGGSTSKIRGLTNQVSQMRRAAFFRKFRKRETQDFMRRRNFRDRSDDPIRDSAGNGRSEHRADFQGEAAMAQMRLPQMPSAPGDQAREHGANRQRRKR